MEYQNPEDLPKDKQDSLQTARTSSMIQNQAHLLTTTESENQRAMDNLTIRRQKNRERQRRYRARKRMEVEMKRSCMMQQHISFPTESASTETTSPKSEPRICYSRKWKKDARKMHGLKPISSAILQLQVESNFDGPLHGRRDWKADARNRTDTKSPENFVFD